MLRTALLLSSLFAAACTVGDLPTNRGNGQVDAGAGMMIDAAAMGNGCVNRIVPPGDAHQHGGAGGPTHAGEDCIVAGCHANNALGNGAPGFQFAGTVYKVGTTTPNTGLTIHVVSGATVLTGVTDTAGNFNIGAGSLAGAFTATTDVTACPDIKPMVTKLTGGGGGGPGANSCNRCHKAAGGTTTPITL
jgi:hypothetical protein